MPSLKALYVTELFPDPETRLGYWGGEERQVYELSTRAAKAGHRVTVMTCRLQGQPERSFVDGEVRRAGFSRDSSTRGAEVQYQGGRLHPEDHEDGCRERM